MMILLQRSKIGAWMFGAILLLCACCAHATDYYVDCTNGNNSAAGTIDQPWRTPLAVGKYATVTGFNAGDGIYFHRDCSWHDGSRWGGFRAARPTAAPRETTSPSIPTAASTPRLMMLRAPQSSGRAQAPRRSSPAFSRSRTRSAPAADPPRGRPQLIIAGAKAHGA